MPRPVGAAGGHPAERRVLDYDRMSVRLVPVARPALVEAIHRALALRPETRVADLGCGLGVDAANLRAVSGSRVVALDTSIGMLLRCPTAIPCVSADVLHLPIRSASVNAAYAVNLLQLLVDRMPLFWEIGRILKIGGRVALPVTTPAAVRRRFLNSYFPSLAGIDARRYAPPRVLREELWASGFVNVTVLRLNLGRFSVDGDYVRRQRTGIFSGIQLLSAKERRDGLRALAADVRVWERAGVVPSVRWVRILITAEKGVARK